MLLVWPVGGRGEGKAKEKRRRKETQTRPRCLVMTALKIRAEDSILRTQRERKHCWKFRLHLSSVSGLYHWHKHKHKQCARRQTCVLVQTRAGALNRRKKKRWKSLSKKICQLVSELKPTLAVRTMATQMTKNRSLLKRRRSPRHGHDDDSSLPTGRRTHSHSHLALRGSQNKVSVDGQPTGS